MHLILHLSKMVDTGSKHFGKLTIAVANAGITLFGDFLTTRRKHCKK
jgi:hypothetical protein